MRHKHGILFWIAGSFIAISLVGCAGTKFNQSAVHASSPVPGAQVEFFEAGHPPARSFEVISALSTAEYSSGSFRKAMQEAAGKLGADAVLGVHDFRAPRTIGIHLQSGIAVRWIKDGQALPVADAKPGVAFVTLLEAPIENPNTFAEIRDTMLLIGGLQLHSMGYSPIYVSRPPPSDTKVPAAATFNLLNSSEARLCDKMVVLRLLRRSQVYGGVAGSAEVELNAQLISKADNSVLWNHTNHLKRVGIGPGGAINVAGTSFMGQAAAQTLRGMPKNQ